MDIICQNQRIIRFLLEDFFQLLPKGFYIPIQLKMIYIIEVIIMCLIGDIAIIFF